MNQRAIRAAELVRLVNSTPLGEVLSASELNRHRQSAGMRIAASEDPSKIDTLRWIGWLCADRHGLNSPPPSTRGPASEAPRGPTLLDVRIRTELLRVRRAEMELDQREGKLLDASEVRAAAGRHARRLVAMLERLSHDAAADLLSAGIVPAGDASRASAVIASRVDALRRAIAEDPLGRDDDHVLGTGAAS